MFYSKSKFPFKWTGIFYELDRFDSDPNHQTVYVSMTRMLFFVASWQSQLLSVKKTKKSKEKTPHEMVSDQTNVRLNPPLIRPFPSWSDLWPYHPQTEVTSDHSIPRPKWILIIQSDHWSYYCALESNPRPCNFGLGTHRVYCSWSDQRSLPDCTSTCEEFRCGGSP